MSYMTLGACATVYAADRRHLRPELSEDTFRTNHHIPASVCEHDDLTRGQSLLTICMACNEKADLQDV